MEIAGEAIDLRDIDVPVCFVSTVEDHIAPWKSTYAGVGLVSGSVKFILGGSGHIAGVVNPPEAKKYGYSVSDKPPATPEEFMETATLKNGSWWPEWQKWISRKAGKKIEARRPGDGDLEIIEDAPGSYAMLRLDQVD